MYVLKKNFYYDLIIRNQMLKLTMSDILSFNLKSRLLFIDEFKIYFSKLDIVCI